MKKLVLLLLHLVIPVSLAQTGNTLPLFTDGIIKGLVMDSSAEKPLQFANVTIHKSSDSAYLGGTATGTNGEFIITNVTEGNYFIKISYIGYDNKFVPGVKVYKDQAKFDAGTIKLSKSTYELSAANVVGERAGEELHLDKKIINVSQNLTAAGGTALDVLQNQPSVRVDPDGSVYLRGSSNFTVLINGKPGVLQGSDALKQISANMIENIELITNPSAKYDAEGSAGIININLKKQTASTFSGIANANSGTRDKYNGDFTMNYNVNGMNLTGGLDYRNNSYYNNQEINRNSYYSTGSAVNLTDLSIRDKRRQYSGRGGIDYTFNPLNSLSFSLSSGKIEMMRSLSSKVSSETPQERIYAHSINTADAPITYLNSTLNFTHKFNPEVNDVSFELTYSRVDLPNDQLTNEYTTDSEFQNRNSDPKRTFFGNDAVRNELRGKLNYTHKINSESTFETGIQSNINYRTFDIENSLFDWGSSEYIVDETLTNNFKMRNNVYSGFVTYSNMLFDFNFMGGLRAEYMDRLLEQKTMGNDYAYDKLDFFPSLSVSRKIDDHQLQFSYSRRINRPNENLLNPFPFYSDTYLSSSGNPELLPEYINSYELNYQKMYGEVFVSVQTYFRNSNNSLLQTFTVDEKGKLYTKFGNFAETNTYGSEISGSFSISMFRFDPAINLFGSELEGNVAGLEVSRDFFNWSARLNTTVTITPDTRLQVSGNYFAKNFDAQSEFKSVLLMNASVRQDFMEKKFSLTLQARNFLRTSYFTVNSKGLNFNSSIHVKPEVPIVSLMLTYNFNNFKRSAKPTDNIDIPTGL
jgi:outer membrane receptor protein involved in Fe transport